MMSHYFNKACLVSCIVAGSSLSYAGAMGDVQDNSKRFFAYVAPIYGSLSDEGINKTPFADTIITNGVTAVNNSNMINLDSRWGYSLGVGYQFGPEKAHDLVLSYTNLKNRGTNSAVVELPGDYLVNRLSQIVQAQFEPNGFIVSSGGKDMIGPASAWVDAYYKYQTGELITHHNFQSTLLNDVHFSRYYGIKAAEFRKGFSALYAGNLVSLDPNFQPTIFPMTNGIDYEAKYFGIGPKIGMGATWDFSRYFSIVGDVSAALLGGSYKTSWNEILSTSPAASIPKMPQTGQYTYAQASKTKSWVPIVIGSNLAIATHFDMQNGGSVGIQGGINTEQYWSQTSPESVRSANSKNNVYFPQRIAIRDVFIKLSYLA